MWFVPVMATLCEDEYVYVRVYGCEYAHVCIYDVYP